ncbi:MAG: hypothetical protein KJN64_06080 [Ignavibacteria bacterium]|nr:hypothetical protein [Ignavibacteria bacterium]MBT8381424.1 hypothetical protein [Ignavibacteria bacterium]NNL20596.1 hypothetical protein [Ignavibacteriaceae bacterium]
MRLTTNRNVFRKLILGIAFAVLVIISLACEKNDIPESELVNRDGIIYKKGSDIPFTGRERARIDGNIIEYDIVNGIKHGEFLFYYEDGTPQIKGKIDSNKNVDKWQYFYLDGSIESEGYFVEDQPEGRWVWFYPSGQLKEEGSYHKGNRVGWWKQFDENGNVIFENEFELADSLALADSVLSNRKKLPF